MVVAVALHPLALVKVEAVEGQLLITSPRHQFRVPSPLPLGRAGAVVQGLAGQVAAQVLLGHSQVQRAEVAEQQAPLVAALGLVEHLIFLDKIVPQQAQGRQEDRQALVLVGLLPLRAVLLPLAQQVRIMVAAVVVQLLHLPIPAPEALVPKGS